MLLRLLEPECYMLLKWQFIFILYHCVMQVRISSLLAVFTWADSANFILPSTYVWVYFFIQDITLAVTLTWYHVSKSKTVSHSTAHLKFLIMCLLCKS